MKKNYVDEIMRRMQGTSKKAAIVGFGALPMRMGVAECRRESRETYRVPNVNQESCLRVSPRQRKWDSLRPEVKLHI
jgi:hypothetical protein